MHEASSVWWFISAPYMQEHRLCQCANKLLKVQPNSVGMKLIYANINLIMSA